MPTIWWSEDHGRLKSYSATVRGQKSVVKIEVEIADPSTLGFLLEELGRVEADQKRQRAPVARKSRARTEQIEHVETLMLPYHGGRP